MSITIKIIVILLALFMVFNLFKALITLLRNDPNKPTMSTYIGRRVLASAFIVLILVIAILTGVITPNPQPY